MKKVLFLSLCALSLVACKQNKSNVDAAMMHQRDSLNQIISQKESEIDEIMSIVNEIEDGFRQINEAEQRVSIAKQGEGADRATQIKENLMFIQSTMQQNRELIDKLNRQMRQSTFKSEQLKRTIENLTEQLAEKDQQIANLMAELDSKNIQISELDEKVANLNENVSNLEKESSDKTETINTQDAQLNTAWFVFGTKSELKEQRILVDGEVLQADFNKDYFTKIDIRRDKEVKLYSRSAKMLTSHPISSYTLQRDANKQYVLRITDPQQFWATSKYLVILVK
ncbi:MAG: hypothetical protein IKD19_08040 [Prevotella sp.]|nr:hypothetical protein [Prevotella sp.]MBO5468000.1 hypothetical protein [Prevotella sp.]MBR2035975.1 hypothetical protein [Prevotella sp.]MBR7172136.1 hypothetical protein [Prevotella sp.]